jgi:hypothetical protein
MGLNTNGEIHLLVHFTKHEDEREVVRHEVFTAVTRKNVVFWNATPRASSHTASHPRRQHSSRKESCSPAKIAVGIDEYRLPSVTQSTIFL